MKLGVLSDTHGDVTSAQEAVDALRAHDVSMMIHCGDVGSAVVPVFRGLPAHFVPGNVDDLARLRGIMTAPEHRLHERLGTLELEGRRIAFLHGHDVRLLRETIRSGQWDLVCHGHSHVYSEHSDGPTLVLNPGALWRTSHPSLAVVDLPSLQVAKVLL